MPRRLDLTRLFEEHRLLKLEAAELFIRAGDPIHHLYSVEKGLIRQYALSSGGEELTVSLYTPGSYFFLPWGFGILSNPYYFEAVIPSLVRQAPKEVVMKHILSDPVSLESAAARGFVGLQVLMSHMESQTFGDARQKVASIICMLAKLLGVKRNGVVELQLPLTHQLLASIVGLARETVSRELSEMRKEGVLDYYNQLVKIPNESLLQEMAGIQLNHFDGLQIVEEGQQEKLLPERTHSLERGYKLK